MSVHQNHSSTQNLHLIISFNHHKDVFTITLFIKMTEVMMTIMMIAVIAVIKYFKPMLDHQHIHLILPQFIRAEQKRQDLVRETVAAAATLSKHRQMHVVFTSLPKLNLPTASLISPPLSTNHRRTRGRALFCQSFVLTSSLLMGK